MILFSDIQCYSKLDITYGKDNIKQWHTTEYLGSHLDSNLGGESMVKKSKEISLQAK